MFDADPAGVLPFGIAPPVAPASTIVHPSAWLLLFRTSKTPPGGKGSSHIRL